MVTVLHKTGSFVPDLVNHAQNRSVSRNVWYKLYLSQNAKRASARKDTGPDQSLFSVQLFRLWISIIKVYKGSI